MRIKWFKAFIAVVIIVPWSIVILLLLQIKNIVLATKDKPIPVIEVADTIINEQPKFFSQTPKEGLEEALSY